PEVGQIVRVRQRLYLVEGLVARPRPQDSTLVELSCIEDDAQGQELVVLWERELDAAILTGEEWARLAQRGFDSAEYFSAYLNTIPYLIRAKGAAAFVDAHSHPFPGAPYPSLTDNEAATR